MSGLKTTILWGLQLRLLWPLQLVPAVEGPNTILIAIPLESLLIPLLLHFLLHLPIPLECLLISLLLNLLIHRMIPLESLLIPLLLHFLLHLPIPLESTDFSPPESSMPNEEPPSLVDRK
ncbi:uncharacterized protein LOC130677596 isoform X1 [Microplitis mediator]|uniref:uncharacterized protein LOC130677596 isoform X1 n=1 Tax=Microplitis mediator TaxID=375433 RepID=UPI0025534827|nr:uncharacterized protein LOC130677596 isoform X1 [Microplitis mediator]XP_057340418.1 uncharacterized protein LOC130677596 isoform X1 [Microplitis mediator]